MSNLPINAKRVFKGILFDVYQWEQELFDGSFQTFEKVIRLSSSQIFAITPNKKIILYHEEQPSVGKFISLPGGIIERGETPTQNAKKELLEETGMIAESFELLKTDIKIGKVGWDTYYFIAKKCEKIQEPSLEAGEKITPFEVTFEKFIEYTQKKSFRNKDLTNKILKLKQTPEKMKEFKNKLFK